MLLMMLLVMMMMMMMESGKQELLPLFIHSHKFSRSLT